MRAAKKVRVNLDSDEILPRYSDTDLTVLAGKIGLSLEQLKAVQRAAWQTYEQIGPDLVNKEGAKKLKRSELIEMVVDCINPFLSPELNSWITSVKYNMENKYNMEDIYTAVGTGANFAYPVYEWVS